MHDPACTVSVVIPAYNAAWCVRRAIDSVLAQTYRDFELLVIDDGSTDDTPSVLLGYGTAIRIIRQPNGGLSSARNAGIRAARGDFVAFLDADDWWLPRKLELQVELLRSQPELGFCSSAARVQDAEGQLLGIWVCPDIGEAFIADLFRSNGDVAGSGSAVMARRELFSQVGGFDETLRSLEDIDMWMRLAAITKYGCIPEPLTVILKSPGSMSRNLDVMRSSAIRVMKKNRQLLPTDLQAGYWRSCLAGIISDYAKWRYREGRKLEAFTDILLILVLAPMKKGRLGLGLLVDFLLRRSV